MTPHPPAFDIKLCLSQCLEPITRTQALPGIETNEISLISQYFSAAYRVLVFASRTLLHFDVNIGRRLRSCRRGEPILMVGLQSVA